MTLRQILERLFREAFDIREGEAGRALLMQLYIFLVISSLLIVKPVGNSLFLSQFGVEQLPNAFILVAIFATAVSALYSRLLKTIPIHRLITRTIRISIASLAVFRCFLYFDFWESGILYIFYVWVAMFAVISASQFWILANLIFNPREAKRLFGFIGAGAIAGGIFGGYLTTFLAPLIGSENLLFICMGFLAICIPIIVRVWNANGKEKTVLKFQQQKRLEKPVDNPLKLIVNSHHLTYLAGIVGVGVLAAKMVDYQFSAIASKHIPDEDQLTAFFGFWLSNLNIVSLVIQLFITRRVVGVFGVGTSLFFLPVGILIGALAVLIYPALWTAVMIKISDGSLKQSVNRAGLELLILPISAEVKNQAKTFIDVFVDSLATGLSGFLLIFLTQALNLSERWVSLLIILVIIVWIYLVRGIRAEYIQSFRARIERGEEEPIQPILDLQKESVFGGLIKMLEGDNEKQVLLALEIVKEVRNNRLIPCFQKLIRHPSSVVRREVLKNIYFYKETDFLAEVQPLVQDEDEEVRTEAIHYLFQHAPGDRVAMIQNYLQHPDYRLRGAALLCAARESRKNQDLRETFRIQERVEQAVREISHLSDEKQLEFTKINCAKVIGTANIPELYPYLHIFLNAVGENVLKAAIASAAQTGGMEFFPVLVEHLANNQLRKTAILALSAFGIEGISMLESYLNNLAFDENIRRNIPRVIASIGLQKAVDVLLENLEHSERFIRYEIIKALNHARGRYPHLKFDDRRITKKILAEARNYLNTLAVLYKQANTKAVNASTPGNSRVADIEKTRKLLMKILEERLDHNLERIFRLLGLKYPPDDIYNVYLGIRSDAPDIRTNALEFLDNLLEPGLKKIIIPIVESTLAEALIDDILEDFNIEVPPEFNCFVRLLSGDDQGVKVPVLKLIGYLKDDRYVLYIGDLVNSPNAKVREAAKFALREIGILQKTAVQEGKE